ncbi:MAG: PqqD family protein [Bacteroidia bacterium]
MKIKKNVAISESGFIFNPTTGDSFSTNPIGLEIIRMLKEEKSKDEIRKSILGKYITDESTFEKDYYDFVMMLQSNQVADDSE